jgi:lysozyme family protein
MTQANFARALPLVLEYEGGFTKDKRDPGNWTGGKVGVGELRGTNKGIAAASFPTLDIEHLTDAQIAEIYRAKYWVRVRGDDLPSGVDLSVMDGGVMSGPSRSVKWLQAVVGETQDGLPGPVTLNAAKKADAPKTIKAHCAKRLGFVRSLAIWNTFGKGWSRRIANVEATALSWVLTKAEMDAEAKAAKDKATQQAGGAVVVTGAGTADQAAGGLSGLPWWGIAIVVVLIAAPLVIRFVINRQRAAALASKAA